MYEPKLTRPSNGGTQKIYRFDNNRGSSVVQHDFSYGGKLGLWELAVLKFTGPGIDDRQLDYSTPITTDVLGHLTEEEVETVLSEIEALEP